MKPALTPLSQESIIALCGRQAFIRGRAYFREGRVGKLSISSASGHMLIQAEVQGSDFDPYSVNIAVINQRNRMIPLGECTCPMRANCKHVAAVCLAYIQQFITPGLDIAARADPVEQWLKRLHDPNGKAGRVEVEETRVILYLLQPDQNAAYRYRIATVSTRMLKKGGYGKAQQVALERVLETYSSLSFATDADREIATLLTRGQRYLYHYGHPLNGDLGALAFRKMLKTGRLHWLGIDGPALQAGEPRALTFIWKDHDHGKRLHPAVTPPASHLLLIDQLHYVDLESREGGALRTHLAPAQIDQLLDAPTIPRDRLEDVSRRLLLEVPEYALTPPVPIDVEVETLAGLTPTPRLQLRADPEQLADYGGHAVELGFLYDRFVLPPTDQETLTCEVEGNHQYRIERNLDAERDAVQHLRECALQALPDRPGVPRTPGGFAFQWSGALRNAQQWERFLAHDLPRLEALGWQIERDAAFRLRFDTVDEWQGDWAETEEDGWFALSLGVEVDGERVNLLPALVELLKVGSDPVALRAWLTEQPYILAPVDEYRWLKLPTPRVLAIFDTLVELYDQAPLDDDGRLRFSRTQALQLGDLLLDDSVAWHGGGDLAALSARLQDFAGVASVAPPQGLRATLRGYQQHGLDWLDFLREFGFNGILADDMGLGKTVQTLALLLREKELGRASHASLIVAPTSLIGNWRREAANFTPDLKVLVLHGAERKQRFTAIGEHDLVLTSYALARRDWDTLRDQPWHYLILDEAQAIKNPKAFTTQAISGLKAKHKLCLTGTPMENHLGELWSIFEFLMPGLLGTQDRFQRLFRRPIEQLGDGDRGTQLRKRIQPFLLRRTKRQVASELPEKVEMIRSIALEGRQRDLYESVRLAMDKKIREVIGKQGLARSHIMILDALLKLRQICCDPRLVKLDRARQVTTSAKLEMLLEILPEMVEEGRKILLFSQFTSMLSLIEAELERLRIRYSKLTGQTRDRDRAVDAFQHGDAKVFLISLKAGGVGLNLTAADTVIHYDPWWNPAVEQQATDRAHRIGQDKTVFVYKLITENTVEDRMLVLQQKKQALADAVHGKPAAAGAPTFTADELLDLFKPLG
ncbi:MAG: SNF2-related protein [Thiotrichales bacterium]